MINLALGFRYTIYLFKLSIRSATDNVLARFDLLWLDFGMLGSGLSAGIQRALLHKALADSVTNGVTLREWLWSVSIDLATQAEAGGTIQSTASNGHATTFFESGTDGISLSNLVDFVTEMIDLFDQVEGEGYATDPTIEAEMQKRMRPIHESFSNPQYLRCR